MISITLLAKIKPVKPPKLKLNKKPIIKNNGVIKNRQLDHKLHIQLNNLMPVGIAIIDVDDVKYARVSISKPTMNMWWPHTIQPKKPIRNNAISMESLPNMIHMVNLLIMDDTRPNAGKISM